MRVTVPAALGPGGGKGWDELGWGHRNTRQSPNILYKSIMSRVLSKAPTYYAKVIIKRTVVRPENQVGAENQVGPRNQVGLPINLYT